MTSESVALRGRNVYGGGGIMPDVFVPRDTMELTQYLSQLYNKNIIREYTLKYYRDHRKTLEKMPFEKFSKGFEVTDKMLQEVVHQDFMVWEHSSITLKKNME